LLYNTWRKTSFYLIGLICSIRSIGQDMDSLMNSDMSEKGQNATSTDNGGRRSGGDRRKYSYTVYIPERRSGKDRRDGKDRRMIPRYKIPSD
jgi:hypothetical protein